MVATNSCLRRRDVNHIYLRSLSVRRNVQGRRIRWWFWYCGFHNHNSKWSCCPFSMPHLSTDLTPMREFELKPEKHTNIGISRVSNGSKRELKVWIETTASCLSGSFGEVFGVPSCMSVLRSLYWRVLLKLLRVLWAREEEGRGYPQIRTNYLRFISL